MPRPARARDGNHVQESAAVEIDPVLQRVALAPAGIEGVCGYPPVEELERLQRLALGEPGDEFAQARSRDARSRIVGLPVEPSLQGQPGRIEQLVAVLDRIGAVPRMQGSVDNAS